MVHDRTTGRTSLVTRTYLVPESIVARGLRFAALGVVQARRALAAPSVQWTLGSWVVRPRMGDEPGHLLVHTTFLPLAVFGGDRGMGLASAVGFEVAEVRRALGEGGEAAGLPP